MELTHSNTVIISKFNLSDTKRLHLEDSFLKKPDPDFLNLMVKFDVLVESMYQENLINFKGESDEMIKDLSSYSSFKLNEEVLDWLSLKEILNIEKTIDSIDIAFKRKNDALEFISKFSVYKKPTTLIGLKNTLIFNQENNTYE